jgi:hypothetical protein
MTYTIFCAKVLYNSARLALLLLIAANLHTDVTAAQTVQDTIKLGVDDPRPVAKAVEELVSRYGYVITYEDPRHAYEGDIQDVTTSAQGFGSISAWQSAESHCALGRDAYSHDPFFVFGKPAGCRLCS